MKPQIALPIALETVDGDANHRARVLRHAAIRDVNSLQLPV